MYLCIDIDLDLDLYLYLYAVWMLMIYPHSFEFRCIAITAVPLQCITVTRPYQAWVRPVAGPHGPHEEKQGVSSCNAVAQRQDFKVLLNMLDTHSRSTSQKTHQNLCHFRKLSLEYPTAVSQKRMVPNFSPLPEHIRPMELGEDLKRLSSESMAAACECSKLSR